MKCFVADRWNGIIELESFPFPVVEGFQSIRHGENENGRWIPVLQTCTVRDAGHFHDLCSKWGDEKYVVKLQAVLSARDKLKLAIDDSARANRFAMRKAADDFAEAIISQITTEKK